jgi:hypothetical protein
MDQKERIEKLKNKICDLETRNRMLYNAGNELIKEKDAVILEKEQEIEKVKQEKAELKMIISFLFENDS